MYKTEIIIFIVLSSLIVSVFFCGIFLFAFSFRKRRKEHEQEKELLQQQHRLAISTARAEIQQQTMQDIGRELHDHIGQKLTLASIYAQQLEHEQPAGAANSKLAAISNIINESLAGLRQLSRNLTDATLENNTLHELLQRESERVNALGRCKFTFESGIAAVDTSYHTRVFVLRIVQEFVQNSLKHAQCRNILATAQLAGTQLIVKLADDGLGFDAGGGQAQGIGLENMKKRAALLGAQFSLTSTPGTGTELLLAIPLAQTSQ